jgi:hypothetical protein
MLDKKEEIKRHKFNTSSAFEVKPLRRFRTLNFLVCCGTQLMLQADCGVLIHMDAGNQHIRLHCSFA